ncbi:MAG: long-chain fatty acid--CoA ligase [Gemmatimonadota bacterium]|nr:long-chain fatty acid--CoA ligase [Gemmatimonadota bacterium]
MKTRVSTPILPDYELGTVVDLFLDGLDPKRAVVARTRNPDGTWTPHSSGDVGERVRALALGLRTVGLERHDRVAILSHTRLEWAQADFGVVMAGLVSVPVYPVLPADQIRHVLSDSGARGIVLADQEQLEKVLEVLGDLPQLEKAWVIEPFEPPGGTVDLEVESFGDLAARGQAAEPELGDSYEAYARATRPEDLATLIYTSGTTGLPKGVMLSHGNFHSNAVLGGTVVPVGPGDTALALLPLAHVFERLVGNYAMWRLGVTLAYAESPMTVARDLGEVQPTVMAAVPRVFEKVLERAEAAAREGGGAKAGIFEWARRVGELKAERELAGSPPGPILSFQARIADRLVFSKLRARTGGNIRFFLSGGAPLPPAVARFFFAAGLPILEGYGLTETSPALTFNPVDAVRIGTVGRPIPGTEIRIAEDGEILARGPQIMQGYYNLPDATAEAIDAEGWFHTGDVGEIDDEEYLRITDRKKDLIITAYGKNIAPQPIENDVKRHPLVAEAVMIGDRRKFPIMIVVPDYDAARSLLEGGAEMTDDDLFSHAPLHVAMSRAVLERCADLAKYERPRDVLVLPGPFTIEGGELTPTLKVKRRVVVTRFADRIDELYEEAELEADAGAMPEAREGSEARFDP